MGLEPISFREMEKQTEDIYEAVIVMALRAKQLLRDRLVAQTMKEAAEDEFGVFDQVPEVDPDAYEEQEKVTSIATKEFLNGELSWYFPSEEED
jgi:DNA-directed RNA polymerase subunit K/omega